MNYVLCSPGLSQGVLIKKSVSAYKEAPPQSTNSCPVIAPAAGDSR